MALPLILLPLGFYFVVKGADLLVDGAVSIARRYGISLLVIGLTIVAFGTSAPELFVNILASISENGELAFGNIIGSNISNTLMVLGVIAVLTAIHIEKKIIQKEIGFSLIGIIIIFLFILFDHETDFFILDLPAGITLLLLFIIYLGFTFKGARSHKVISVSDTSKRKGIFKSTVYIIIGTCGLSLGGHWIVNGAVYVADMLKVSHGLIGLTLVAIGTSLPELATSAVAAIKNKADLAIGNILGSNIFNLLWVLGVSALINPMKISYKLLTDIILMGGTSLLIWGFLLMGKSYTLKKWHGYSLIICYLGYLTYIISREESVF